MRSSTGAATSSDTYLRRYAGRVSLITGASSGIGTATAWRLSAEAARIHLVDVDAPGLDTLADALREVGRVATTSVVDISDPEGVRGAIEDCVSAHGRLDTVANNAGVYAGTPLDEITIDEWDRVMRVNLEGSFLVAQAAAERLSRNSGAAITNIASVYGAIGDTFDPMASYAASKAGVASMTRQLAVEFAPLGIRVNAICPGMVETPMNDTWMSDRATWDTFITQKIPASRPARAEEVAALHAFLGSKEASYVTGALIFIDGGWSAS